MDQAVIVPAVGREPALGLKSSLSGPSASNRPQKPRALLQRVSSIARGVTGRLSGSSKEPTERRVTLVSHDRKQILETRMASAETYEQWETAAIALDALEGYDVWKESDESDEYYNPDLLASRMHDLDNARQSGDISHIVHLVRTALSRDLGGTGSPGLYNHSHVGTKQLVERYVHASVGLIEALVQQSSQMPPSGLSQREILSKLMLARRNFGRSALVLSGGSVYGMAHIGVLKTLFEKRLLPRIISGTSAGSIVAAMVCVKKDDEIPDVIESFAHGDLAVFTDSNNPESWFTHIGRAVQYGRWHDNKHISRVMQEMLGDMTFQEAFNRTRRILNITVSSKPGLHLPHLLNYMTAPNVIVWSAVVASCSVPGVFDPRPLLVRDEATGEHIPWDPAEQLWLDGSLDNDIPVERLGELLGVNHFIVSQANPHIVVFVTNEEKRITTDDKHSRSFPSSEHVKELVYAFGRLGKTEIEYCLENLIETGIFKGSFTMLKKMLNQKYTGDINIIPRMSLWWAPYLIKNPTPGFMLEASRVGEQATWPSLCRIEHNLAVELALDRAVYALRERVAFSDSQVNLRRLFTGYNELGIEKGIATESKINYRHHRRGSGGSIQLSARRKLNLDSLEPILSEDTPDSDPESSAPSLAARRGMKGMSLVSMMTQRGQLPPYRGPIKQNSLQHLPMPKSPFASPAATRKGSIQGYGFGGILLPFTRVANDVTPDGNDGDESPVLSMKLKRGGSPVRGSVGDMDGEAMGLEEEEEAADADIEEDHSDAEPYSLDASPGMMG